MTRMASASVACALLLLLLPLPTFAGQQDATLLKATDRGTEAAYVRGAIEDALPPGAQPGSAQEPGRYFATAMVTYLTAFLPLTERIALFAQDRDLSRLAGEICLAERSRVSQLVRWQGRKQPSRERLPNHSAVSFQRLIDEVTATARDDMQSGLSGQTPDVSFVTVLIAQGEGAIDMAKVTLIFEGDDELRKIARNLIGERQAEVKSLRSWLKKRSSFVVYR